MAPATTQMVPWTVKRLRNVSDGTKVTWGLNLVWVCGTHGNGDVPSIGDHTDLESQDSSLGQFKNSGKLKEHIQLKDKEDPSTKEPHSRQKAVSLWASSSFWATSP